MRQAAILQIIAAQGLPAQQEHQLSDRLHIIDALCKMRWSQSTRNSRRLYVTPERLEIQETQ